jgi:hypothetical protein
LPSRKSTATCLPAPFTGDEIVPLFGGIFFWRRHQANREERNSQKADEYGAGSEEARPNGRLVSYSYGTLAGATTMIADAAGPVMTVYLLSAGLAKYAFMGTSAWIFCLINLTKLPFSYALGVINRGSLWFNAFMLARCRRWRIHRAKALALDSTDLV